jgi:tRNA1(Val) A37 N6-methylase TrmN6
LDRKHDAINTHNSAFKRRILELGSGLGICGLYCLKYLNLKSFTFTDVHDLVLMQIVKNVALNDIEQESRVLKLDWMDLDVTGVADSVDVILGSGSGRPV